MTDTRKYTSGHAVAVVELRRLVAQSAAFQSRTGTHSESEAGEKVFMFDKESDDPADMLALVRCRPCAVIWPETWRWDADAAGERNYGDPVGGLLLLLIDDALLPGRAQEQRHQSALEFSDWVGNVIEEVLAHAGETDYLDIRTVTAAAEDGPFRTPTDQEASGGAAWWMRLHVQWGGRL